MPSVCLSFRIHIPYQLQSYSNGNLHTATAAMYSNEDKLAVDRLADECYLPANKLMQQLIEQHKGRFAIAFSISGTAIELLELYRPDALDSFKKLARTGSVEFLTETYYNSFSWLHSKKEFKRQVEMHHQKIETVFGCTPVVFRNTEFIYSNELAQFIAGMGYKGILCEGLHTILQGRTSNQTYAAPDNGDFGILLRNTRLSDDISFRFDDRTWNEQPLTAEKFAGWIHDHKNNTCNINLHFDYETIGIHKKSTTGIFEFLQKLPAAILANDNWVFKLPAGSLEGCYPKDIFDSPQIISWQNKSSENCIWSENTMQRHSLHKIYSMENMVLKSDCAPALDYWARLQSADHFYNMSEQGTEVANAHHNQNPYQSTQAAYKIYKDIITDFEVFLMQQGLESFKNPQRYNSVYNLFGG